MAEFCIPTRERTPMDPRFEWVDFTPEMAEKALATFAKNRMSTRATVEKYARAMRAGLWLMAGDPIRVTTDGTYIDGEHRLRAIILSGSTVRLPVLYGVDPSVMKVIDTGNVRQYKHLLQFAGAANTTILAPLVRRMYLWDKAGFLLSPNGGRSISSLELDAYHAEHPELDGIADAVAHGTPPLMFPTGFGVCMTVFARISPAAMSEFCELWRSGADLAEGHPVLALRTRLMTDAASRINNRVAAETKIALACVGWNAFRERRAISKLNLPKNFSNANYPHPR